MGWFLPILAGVGIFSAGRWGYDKLRQQHLKSNIESHTNQMPLIQNTKTGATERLGYVDSGDDDVKYSLRDKLELLQRTDEESYKAVMNTAGLDPSAHNGNHDDHALAILQELKDGLNVQEDAMRRSGSLILDPAQLSANEQQIIARTAALKSILQDKTGINYTTHSLEGVKGQLMLESQSKHAEGAPQAVMPSQSFGCDNGGPSQFEGFSGYATAPAPAH
jgi:hypothetical protein